MSQTYAATSAYAQASKMVTSLRAVVMLYDGMVKAIAAAKRAIDEGRIEDRFLETQKASKILLGLQTSLDFEKGGEVAANLDRFYSTVFNELQQINLRNSTEKCDSLLNALNEVRRSWDQLAREEAGASSERPAESAPMGHASTLSGLGVSV